MNLNLIILSILYFFSLKVGEHNFFRHFYIITERGFTEVLPKEVVAEMYENWSWFSDAILKSDPLAISLQQTYCGQIPITK